MLTDETTKKFLNWQKSHKGSVTTLAAVDVEGNLYTCENTACHAGLRYMQRWYKSEKPILAIISGVQLHNFSDKEALKFFDWMLFKSPWKNCFLNKNAQEVLNTFWLLNPDAPANLMTSAAFATRHISEWPRCFESWIRLINAGVDETKAFFFSYFLQPKGDSLFVDWGSGGWHQPFSLSRSYTYYTNFLNGTPDKYKVGNAYRDQKNYGHISAIWGPEKVDYTRFLNIKPVKGGKIDVKNLNIFYKEKVGVRPVGKYVFTTDEEIRNLILDMEGVLKNAA
jgi:hypothetical protein